MSETVLSPAWLENCFMNNTHLAGEKWLQAFRQQELKKFIMRGFPTRKEELWKYTDITNSSQASKGWHPANPIATTEKNGWSTLADVAMKATDVYQFVFINGYFSPELSRTESLSAEVTLLPLSQAAVSHEALLKTHLLHEHDENRYPYAKLNSALMTDGMFLHIAKNAVVKKPIHLIFLHTQQTHFITCPRNIIIADENSQVTIIEEYFSDDAENYLTTPVTVIHAKPNAGVNYYKIQNESLTASHMANVFVEQHQDSRVKAHFFSCGAQLEREDVNIFQRAAGTDTQLNGFYFLNHDNQHIDHHVHVDHLAAQGASSMKYKGILDKKSRAVFNGKVFVHPNAKQINAHQENHNLLLSDKAEINTKPELEIYADDVKCTHGATVGQLDGEALFYLLSRGIEKHAAYKMLTRAFVDDVFSAIENLDIRQYIQQRMSAHDEL